MTVQDILNKLNPNNTGANTADTYTKRLEAIKMFRNILNDLTALTNLDEESVENRIKFATTKAGEYGKIGNTLNLISAIYNWPLGKDEEAKLIPDIQEKLLDYLVSAIPIDVEALKEQFPEVDDSTITAVTIELRESQRTDLESLISDLKEDKGGHAYMDKDGFTLVEGTEPNWEDLPIIYKKLLAIYKVPEEVLDYKLRESQWWKTEDRAIKKFEIELASRAEALEAHRELLEA